MVNSYNKKKAFTLAELLVAMLIFAMIAAMLIPNVSQNAEKNLFTTQLKKVQNDVQQALLLMMAENQGTLQAFCVGANAAECFVNQIVGNFGKTVTYDEDKKRTESGDEIDIKGKLEALTTFGTNLTEREDASCTEDNKESKNSCKQKELYEERKPLLLTKIKAYDFSDDENGPYKAANLTNGATISAYFNPECNAKTYSSIGVNANIEVCGFMEIDTNASKVPNIVGKDIHYFWIVDKDGLVPFGEIDNSTCGEEDKKVKAGDSALQQMGCTFKLIQEGRITYY